MNADRLEPALTTVDFTFRYRTIEFRVMGKIVPFSSRDDSNRLILVRDIGKKEKWYEKFIIISLYIFEIKIIYI